MGNTTIEISSKAHVTWKRWCSIKNMSSVELMDRLILECELTRQREFYLSLPKRVEIINKPLMLKRIRESYRKKSVAQ